MEIMDINNLQGEFRTGKLVADEGVIITPVCRLSYEDLFSRTQYTGNTAPAPGDSVKKYFGATFLFNCGNVNEPGLVDVGSCLTPHLMALAQEYWASKNKPVPFEYFYGMWDGRRKQGTDGYGENIWYVSAKNYSESMTCVPVVDANRNRIGPGGIKAGDFVRARIRPYISPTYDHKGINFQLKSVQLLLPWTGFGASEDTGDEWGAVPVPTQAAAPIQGQDW